MVSLYLTIIWRSAEFDVDLKLAWSGFLIIGSPVALPLFFYQYLSKKSKIGSSQG
jgi:hypothetical protein